MSPYHRGDRPTAYCHYCAYRPLALDAAAVLRTKRRAVARRRRRCVRLLRADVLRVLSCERVVCDFSY